MVTQFKQPNTPKIRNMKLLYNLIRNFGPITKSSIIDKTGLKQTTCSRVIDDLLQESLIKESGVAKSSGGRKPVMYDLNNRLYYCIGIDISRTFTKVLLLDLHLNVIDEARLSMTKEGTPADTIDFISQTIVQMVGNNKIGKSQLIGIGIGAVEPLDRKKGIIVDPVNFPNKQWKNVNIVDALQDKFDTKIILDSGINSAVLAENQIGLDGVIGNLSYIIAGMGIRIGVMIDQRLLKSEADRFGKFGSGHMVINTSGRKCICGKYGCFHTYSTIPALKEEIAHQLKLGNVSMLDDVGADPDEVEFEDICKAIEAGDPLCQATIKSFGYLTGIGIANMMTLLYSDYFVLSGPMFNRIDLFYETAVEAATKRIQELYPGFEVRFGRGHLGENAAAIGAGSMVINYYLD